MPISKVIHFFFFEIVVEAFTKEAELKTKYEAHLSEAEEKQKTLLSELDQMKHRIEVLSSRVITQQTLLRLQDVSNFLRCLWTYMDVTTYPKRRRFDRKMRSIRKRIIFESKFVPVFFSTMPQAEC